jgi:hypothetical protein
LGAAVGMTEDEICGVASVILADDMLVMLRPLLDLRNARKVPLAIASLSLVSTLSLVMPLITLAVHTQEALRRALLLPFLSLPLGSTTPVTAVVGTPTESDTLPSRAASKVPVRTSCGLMPSNIWMKRRERVKLTIQETRREERRDKEKEKRGQLGHS